jgi:transposase
MAYCKEVRKLALRMIKQIGIVRTSKLINISRTTLWRWTKNGATKEKRVFNSKLLDLIKDRLIAFLHLNICTDAKTICKFFMENFNIKICTKTVLKFIKRIGFTKKRIRTRGVCKGNYDELKKQFVSKYKDALKTKKTLVAIDECGFNENIKSLYGYSPIGTPPIIKTTGSWIHHSLLMAVFSDGRKEYIIKKGSINKNFVDSLLLKDDSMIIMDNASIHKNLCLFTNPITSYSPPYSPEYNAIELCFGKTKDSFRKINTTLNGNVNELISSSVETLSPQMIINCFTHVFEKFIDL